MKLLVFSKRTAKEILRDPLNLGFGVGFPLILLLLFSAIQANVPVDLFEIERLTPGIAVFGSTFITLFAASLIAKDRESAFLARLYATPMAAADFIGGYMLPLLPIAVAQGFICYGAAMLLGLPATVGVLRAVACMLPVSLFFVAMGLLFGSILTVKQAGSICGALFTNLCAWLSGTWFDLNLVGSGFRRVAYALPFVHAVELERAALSGNADAVLPNLAWVLGYAAVALLLAIRLFLRQMHRQ